MCYTHAMTWKIFKKDSYQKPVKRAETKEQKVKAGIDFTLKNYGEALKDLARYDRGEQLSS